MEASRGTHRSWRKIARRKSPPSTKDLTTRIPVKVSCTASERREYKLLGALEPGPHHAPEMMMRT
jgi:hypothetical protein